MMAILDLKELDRLEQAATQGRQYNAHPKRHNPPYFLMRSKGEGSWLGIADYGAEWAEVELSAAARNQLRPLLDLVERMGEALLKCGRHTLLCPYPKAKGPCDCGLAVLQDYRRAKGE